jgi:ATP-dependent Clp protease ATP-binding subunit ClpC
MSHQPLKHSNALLIAWRLAELEAANLRAEELEPVHFLMALLKLCEFDIESILSENTSLTDLRIQRETESVHQLASCFNQVGLETTRTRRRLRRSMPPGNGTIEMGQHVRRSAVTKEVFTEAEELALSHCCDAVEPLHLMASIVENACAWVLSAVEWSGSTLQDLSDTVRAELSATDEKHVSDHSAKRRQKKPLGKDANTRKTRPGFAERLGRDLTALAREGKLSPVIGRKAEMKTLIQILLRSRKNNAILIGEAGVGKTGVVEGLAQRIADGQVPPEFTQKRIIEISMGSLVAGTNLRGDMEERLQSLITESKRNPDLILFIDEIHLLVGAGQGSGSSMDAANLLKPALARGEVRVIGATTTQEFRRFIEADPALTRRFEVIEVLEPDRVDAIAILRGLRPRIEEHHGIKIHDEALDAAIDLTVRYLPSLRLPDKAIDVLDQACAQVRMRSLSGDFKAQMTSGILIMRKDVAAAVAHRCKVPVGDLQEDDAGRLLAIELELGKRIKGQANAINEVGEAIRLARSGLKKPGGPIAAFLFDGPCGTGKTELSKALAEYLFRDENQLIRIDMSEFMEAHSVSKLIGAPPGFIGHEERGQLTERVRSQPYSVILLDEVEKAHPKILDLFLQVFDSGSLTDAHGTKCDFRETIIIMTSNLGAGGTTRPIGFAGENQQVDASDELEKSVQSAAKLFFRPEFLNRLTGVVVFQPLEKTHVRQILDVLVERLNGRLKDKGVRVELTPDAMEFLMNKGFSQDSGARGLERTIEKEISTPLSKLLIGGEIGEVEVFRVDYRTGMKNLTIG